MKVKELLDVLADRTSYVLVSAYSGKRLRPVQKYEDKEIFSIRPKIKVHDSGDYTTGYISIAVSAYPE